MSRSRASEVMALAHGSLTGRPWVSHELNSAGPWVHPWVNHVFTMRVAHGSLMRFQCWPTSCPWVIHGSPMGGQWVTSEFPMGLPSVHSTDPWIAYVVYIADP